MPPYTKSAIPQLAFKSQVRPYIPIQMLGPALKPHMTSLASLKLNPMSKQKANTALRSKGPTSYRTCGKLQRVKMMTSLSFSA